MSMHDKLALSITGHGEFETTTHGFEQAMAHYLPARVDDLRQKIDGHEANGFQPGHYSNLDTIPECLMVLAYLDSRPTD